DAQREMWARFRQAVIQRGFDFYGAWSVTKEWLIDQARERKATDWPRPAEFSVVHIRQLAMTFAKLAHKAGQVPDETQCPDFITISSQVRLEIDPNWPEAMIKLPSIDRFPAYVHAKTKKKGKLAFAQGRHPTRMVIYRGKKEWIAK